MSAGDITALVGAVSALVVSITALVKLFRHTSEHGQQPPAA